MDEMVTLLEDHGVTPSSLRYLQYVVNVGYTPLMDNQLAEFETPRRKMLAERYHSMNCVQVICVDPERLTDDRFFMTVIGGNSYEERAINYRSFLDTAVVNEPVYLSSKGLAKVVTLTLNNLWFDHSRAYLMSDAELEREMAAFS